MKPLQKKKEYSPRPKAICPIGFHRSALIALRQSSNKKLKNLLLRTEPQIGLRLMGEGASELEDVSDKLEFPVVTSEEPAQEEDLIPSEVADDNDTLTSADDVDALFAVDMPDWLSDAGAQEIGRACPGNTG